MLSIPRQQRGSFIKLTIFVFIAAGVLAGYFGVVAANFYAGFFERPTSKYDTFLFFLGLGWGAVTGLIAAAYWCRTIYRRIERGLLSRLILHGTGAGLLAGLISTLLLHAVLLVFGTHRDSIILLFGLPIGLVAGLILGVISGTICWAIVNARPADQSDKPASPPSTPPEEE